MQTFKSVSHMLVASESLMRLRMQSLRTYPLQLRLALYIFELIAVVILIAAQCLEALLKLRFFPLQVAGPATQ